MDQAKTSLAPRHGLTVAMRLEPAEFTTLAFAAAASPRACGALPARRI